MDSTAVMKKAIADRKAAQAYSLKQLETAVKESKANRHRQTDEQRRTE